jgi:hypothetical protein
MGTAVRAGLNSRRSKTQPSNTDAGASQRRDLMEIVEDRYGRGSILITSQLPAATWHAFHALAIDDGGSRTDFPLRLFTTLLIESRSPS